MLRPSLSLLFRVAVSATLPLWICAPAVADHPNHSTAKVVKATLTGATVEGENAAGKTYRIVYGADGSAEISIDGVRETGSWTVDKGGHYCEQWPKAFDKKKRCGSIEVVAPLLIMRGVFKTTRTVVKAAPTTN
jgi:hypothetical protein